MAEWLTYPEVGERLNISTEAARQRALRGHWQRRMDNHGHALVAIPEGITTHIETLKADLTLAREQTAQAIEAHRCLAAKLAKLKASRKKR